MFLSLFASVFLHIVYVGCQCPATEQMEPCECKVDDPGFEVFCNGSLMEEIGKVLESIDHTKVNILTITIENVSIPSLPSNFLLGKNILYIIIRKCSISSVDENAFADMEATLSGLLLSHNALEGVPTQALERLSKLKMLYLDYNQIQILQAGAFKGLHSLRYLTVFGNKIKSIDNSAFLGLGSSFIYLDLGKNELAAVPCQPLRDQTSLKFLDLESNEIATLAPKEFQVMGGKDLIDLNIANNKISHLPAGLFKTMKALKNLTASGNVIKSIHRTAFEGIEDTLKVLLLRNNQLEEIPSAALRNISDLKSLDLGSNRICRIRKDDFLPYGKSLNIIDLDNNSLVHLDTEAFLPLKSLEYLWLWSNQLKTVSNETIAPVLGTLIYLDIRDNPLHCNCSLSWFHGWMKRQKTRRDEVKCATPQEHANVPLAEIPPDQLICGNETPNPPESCCNCYINNHQHQSSDAFTSRISCIVIFACLVISVITKCWLF